MRASIFLFLGFVCAGQAYCAIAPPEKAPQRPASTQPAGQFARQTSGLPDTQSAMDDPHRKAFEKSNDFILDAQIEGPGQDKIQPGQIIAINAKFRLAYPTSASTLQRAIQVLVDGRRAEKIEPDASADTGASAATGVTQAAEPKVQTERSEIGLAFLVRTPFFAQNAQSVAVALYSEPDGRIVATTQMAVQAVSMESSVPSAWMMSSNASLLMLMAMVLVLFGLFSWQLMRNARRTMRSDGRGEYSHPASAPQSHSTAEAEGNPMHVGEGLPSAAADIAGPPATVSEPSIPELPDSITEAACQDRLVLVLGPGTSAQAGLPTSTDIWLGALSILDLSSNSSDEGSGQRLQRAMRRAGPWAVAEAVVARFGREAVIAALRTVLAATKIRLGTFHERLAKLPCRIIIDMTLDSVAREAFPDARLFTPTTSEDLISWIREDRSCILKPYGELERPDSVSLAPGDLRQVLSRAPDFEKALAGFFSSHSFLFLGLGLPGLDDYLQALPPSLGSGSREHTAVTPHKPEADLWQEGTGRRYGIRVASYVPSANFRELVVMLERLLDGIHRARAAAAQTQVVVQQHLQRVELTNIGIFEKLELDLDAGWTLFLGNNGGGKSTILRAICLALAGSDARASQQAGKLLRNGAKSGRITIQLGRDTIVTELIREETSVRVISPQLTPLQAGRLLALAFPGLRGVSLAAPSGPRPAPPLNPSVDDVAPLLEGLVDSRLDSLKQWIVNTFVQSESSPQGRESRMLQTLSSLVREMVPGDATLLSRVDKQTWKIWVDTRDGPVEFDSISQGMSSIFNWIGVLLRRLYDVYPQSPEPEKEYALVFVDEIDAHLHPNWQRTLVHLTRKHFPNVQVIATTHSPLLAGSVSKDELRIVERDRETGKMTVTKAREDVEGQRVEDILTSSVFALDTTRNPDAEREIKEYVSLYEKLELNVEEEGRLAELKKRVTTLNYGSAHAALPSSDTSEPLKRIADLLAQLPQEAVDTLSEKAGDQAAEAGEPTRRQS